jgi:hypothetical protein
MALFLEKTQDVMAISGYFREQKTEDKKSDATGKISVP